MRRKMPWYERIVPETIKKSVCAYLLQRYLGQFFEEKLTRDQLSVDLYNGTGTVEKISLDVQALNELGEKQNWPMEFVDGYIDKIYISVPWASLLQDSSFVEVNGMKLTLQPKQRTEHATSMFESMWNSMSSSLKLAEECAMQDTDLSTNVEQPYEGLELFAKTIDSILSRVKVKFVNTIIQIEHVPRDSSTGVGVVIHLDLIEYSDEAGDDPTQEELTDLTTEDAKKAYVVNTFTTKNFNIDGITLSTVEFSSKARTFCRSMTNSQLEEDELFTLTDLNQESILDDNETDTDSKMDRCKNSENQRHDIVFGKFLNKQEIKVRLKQSESIHGPKVSIELNLGSLTLFLSPRQIHILVEFANGLAKPDLEDTSNIPQKPTCTEKQMTKVDYQRVEQELQQNLHPGQFQGGLHMGQGWSTSPLDESDTDDNFLPLKNNTSAMFDSAISGASSSMESSLSSSMVSSFTEPSNRTRRRMNNIDIDPTAEISHFQIRIASLAAVVLHEDLMTVAHSGDHILALSSVQQMRSTADAFFSSLGTFTIAPFIGNISEARDVFDKACQLNHIRILAAPIQMEGDEKTTLSSFSITGQLTAAKLEILECLYDKANNLVQHIPLLTFNNKHSSNMPNVKPSVKVNFKHVEKTSKSLGRRSAGPRTDINVCLNNCEVEFDITIIDRITNLLNPETICNVGKKVPHNNPWNINEPMQTPSVELECRTDVKVTSPSLTLKMRFPIPDFRNPHDMNKIPWWQRHVRNDFLSFILSDVTFQTSTQTSQSFQEYDVQSRSVDIFYYESEHAQAIHVAKAGKDEKYMSSMQEVLTHPRLNIKCFPFTKCELGETDPEPDLMSSVFGCIVDNKESGPFSAKKVVHESDTPHSKPQKNSTEELIIPGDKEEIDDFMRRTISNSRIQVDIAFPVVSMQILSKHVYEIIYNRINNDLLLWEPSAPKPKLKTSVYNYDLSSKMADQTETFAMCKSGIQYESKSDSDNSSDGDGAILFYSAFDKVKGKKKLVPPAPETKGQSYLSLNLLIERGLLCLNTPVRDSTTNNVIPGQQGEFLLTVEGATVFVVSGYKGDDDLGYVCVQVTNAQLNHCDMISVPSQPPPLKEIGTAISRHLHPTIYKSERGMLADSQSRGGNRELLTIAVKIAAKHETHHVKTIRVAIGLNKGTLRHKMCHEPNSWISHILDFFNVQDYPIPDYNAKEVLTELHLHLWDCAIDYRPLHIPLRSAVTVGNFSMSSHLTEKSNTSTLRFITEDCRLFLSEKAPPNAGVASTAPVDLKRDYVNVIEVGLFELSLKTNDKKSGIYPHIDLRASNDVIHIHTCADTGRALTQLLSYLATDGDILPNEDVASTVSAFSSPKHETIDQELVSVDQPQDISKLSQSQHQQVNDLLDEAMEECNTVNDDEFSRVGGAPGAKLFYFPDENNVPLIGKPLPQVACDLGDITSHVPSNNDSDDDFYFVGEEAGLGIYPKNGVPEIKWLTNEPVRLVDNHFNIPVGKIDLLKPPKNFPTPIMRYTLCEMNLIWHMYGGNDFKSKTTEESSRKTVNFAETKLKDSVSFSNTGKGEVMFSKVQKAESNVSWYVKGGVNRDQNTLMELQLNKVKFQHEMYPETTPQASRQVLIITEIEMRDRLATSEINKFLYQYTSQARPKQSHAHMVVIKAVHIRPDAKQTTQECCLKVSLLPLRLNIDQDSLHFLINFFNELGGATSEESLKVSSKQNTPTHQPPVMSVSINEDDDELKEQAHKIVDENLITLLEESNLEKEETLSTSSSANTSSPPIFFRNVLFSPDVPIRLDYQGKHVNMTDNSIAGLLMGLLMGLGQLNCSELRLKRISHRHGLLGFEKLMAFLLQEWVNDIKKNQLPSLLGGVGPIHTLVQLIQGIKDLFWMPIEQYQKDGRIVRGLQRGANSFTTSTAMAALELTSRIIHLIQITAETAYDMLSPGPSVRSGRTPKTKGKRRRYQQPQDIREGMTNAYNLVKEGIGETAGNIVQVASHEYEQKGYSGAVGGVLRQIPPTIIKPIIIASEATSNALGGMRSQLVPDARAEANQKWRGNDV